MMGTVSGKLGDVVFSRRLGEQVQRAYIKRVNDASTRSQVVQRSKIANLVSSYRAYRTLLQRAFESKPVGNTDYNVFVGINLSTTSVFLDQHASAAGACVAAPYQISRGVLPTIQVVEQAAGTFVSDIAVPADFELTATTTLSELTTAILSSNADWVEGDQFTTIHAQQWISQDNGFPMLSVRLYEFILSSTSDALVINSMPSNVLSVVDGFLGFVDVAFMGAVGCVHSRGSASGALSVSSQRMLLSENNTVYAMYSSTLAEETAATTRGYNAGVYLNPGTSHATAGGQIGGGVSQQILTLSVSGNNALTLSSLKPGVGAAVTLTGLNLNPEKIRISTYAPSQTLLLSEALTITSSTDTSVTGTVNAAAAVSWRELLAGSAVVKNWVNDDWEDPSA